jgi:lipopolysaccharide/colanic/teichoic acid biosynthesis glycosyltransferase
VKRKFDLFVSIFALLFLLLPMGLLIILVRYKLGSPIFFKQIRPGLHGVPFEIIKFRTMTNEFGVDGTLLSEQERLTPFGAWLRSTSLDELPELWSVIKGDMSLVGPRPLLMEYLPLYSPYQSQRHKVLPGITGWAQVNGRNKLTWEEKFKLDVWYVENCTCWLDFKILLMTVGKVLLRQGISGDGEITMSKFKGSHPHDTN